METIKTYDRVVAGVVDPLNDFGPNGAVPVPTGHEVIEPINRVNRWVRQNKGVVAFLRDQHKHGSKHLKDQGGPWDDHCIEGEWGAELFDGIEVVDGDAMLYKGTGMEDDGYSGFEGVGHDGATLETYVYPTRLEKVALVVVGLCTDYCDKATGLGGITLARSLPADRQLDVFMVSDAIRAVDVYPGDGDRAIAEMQEAGVQFITTDELVNGRVMEIRN